LEAGCILLTGCDKIHVEVLTGISFPIENSAVLLGLRCLTFVQ
jgi:hypothetical protein